MNLRHSIIFSLLAILSVLVKVSLAYLGYNWDLISFNIVSDLVLAGKSVYANTDRYNYGPFWFYILAILKWITIFIYKDSITAFHILIAFFLSIIDILISLLLLRQWGIRIALIFLLNPVSMIITGFHCQFDSIAILFSLLSVLMLSKKSESTIRLSIYGGLLLGCSLIFKHSFIFFPFWICLYGFFTKRKELIYAGIISVAIFCTSFVPWLFDPESRMGILNNVIKYSSRPADTLLDQILRIATPWSLIETYLPFLGQKKIFLMLLIGAAIIPIIKKSSLLTAWLYYTLCLFCFSSAMANQYLILPLIPLCVFCTNRIWIPYCFFSSVFLLFSPDGLGEVLGIYLSFALLGLRFFNLQFWALCLLIVLLLKKPSPPSSQQV
jgi:hypothetical protein